MLDFRKQCLKQFPANRSFSCLSWCFASQRRNRLINPQFVVSRHRLLYLLLYLGKGPDALVFLFAFSLLFRFFTPEPFLLEIRNGFFYTVGQNCVAAETLFNFRFNSLCTLSGINPDC